MIGIASCNGLCLKAMLKEDNNDTEIWEGSVLLSISKLKPYQEKRINGTGRKRNAASRALEKPLDGREAVQVVHGGDQSSITACRGSPKLRQKTRTLT